MVAASELFGKPLNDLWLGEANRTPISFVGTRNATSTMQKH